MKLCKDCRWAKAPEGLRELFEYDFHCMHPTSVVEPQIDYVLGRTWIPKQMKCAIARVTPESCGCCGPSGQYWEPIGERT